MRSTLLLLFALFNFLGTQAQFYTPGSLRLTNNTEIQGKFIISTSTQSVEAKNNKISYTFNLVESLTIQDRVFTKKTFEGNSYLAHELVSGKARLYQIESNKYLFQMKNGIYKELDIKNNPTLISGILSVLFEDCNTIRNEINNTNSFSEKILINLTVRYNSCSYQEYKPTEAELKNANTFETDLFMFYVGFGMNIKKIDFFESYYKKDLYQYGIKFGVKSTPGFAGKIQGNLYFYFDASLSFGSDTAFTLLDTNINYSINSHHFIVGVEYYFNKNGNLKPFIGIGGGSISDYYSGDIDNTSFKVSDHNIIWVPKAGLSFALNNGNDIEISAEFISEYENGIKVPTGEGDENIVAPIKSSSLSFGLKYYF